MWDFFETVRHRHSVRKYRSDSPVEKEKLHAILEMACAAPSAGDLQSYHIVVVETQTQRDSLSQAAEGQAFISEAPVCLVFCSDPHRAESEYGQRGRELFALQDTTIAAAYAQLAIVAAGMASTWVGSFDAPQVRELLELDTLNPDSPLQPVALLSIGYPAELPEPTPRRPLEKMISYR
ncbi:MAG: nitroreductase family protein [Gammaproteobacteria bacterium]|nr:nitroreductase family protein [Gammaproteobacteria bacterium]